MSSIVRRLIDMDAQDAQDYLARVSTVMSSTIASVPTRTSQNPLPGSWITSNTHPIIERVCFLWRSLSCCLSCLSKELSTKGHEERRRATKALRLTATGCQGREGIIDFRLFHSGLIRTARRGRNLSETTPCAAWRETRSMSSIVRRLIDMDAQDAQDYLARVSTVMSSTIASVPTRISQNPLPGSWITSNTHPIIQRVCFLWRNLSCCLSCLSCVSMFNK